MSQKNVYIIPFVGLKSGLHHFDFILEQNFFAKRNYSLIKNGFLNVSVELQKQEIMMVLDFVIDGKINVTCDRCLEDFEMPIKMANRLIVKFGEKTIEESDEIIVLQRNEFELDIAQYIYEFATLALPFRIVHPDSSKMGSTCNKDVLKLLDQMQPHSDKTKKVTDKSDPRWEALKNLSN